MLQIFDRPEVSIITVTAAKDSRILLERSGRSLPTSEGNKGDDTVKEERWENLNNTTWPLLPENTTKWNNYYKRQARHFSSGCAPVFCLGLSHQHRYPSSGLSLCMGLQPRISSRMPCTYEVRNGEAIREHPFRIRRTKRLVNAEGRVQAKSRRIIRGQTRLS